VKLADGGTGAGRIERGRASGRAACRVQRKADKVQLTTQPECAPYIEKFLGLDSDDATL